MTMPRNYNDRTDLQRIQSQWNKLKGLQKRNEHSAAIVRAATAAEIAANFAIRKEFANKSQFDKDFIDGLLRWANGIAGKMQRLLIPLSVNESYKAKIKKLEKLSSQINFERNEIAHSGAFGSPEDAESVIKDSKEFIETLVNIYDPTFALQEKPRARGI